MKREIEFMSDGDECRGWLITPDKGKGPFPTIIITCGWCYVKEIVMPDYADVFVKKGFATLLFDYRNFGGSEGIIWSCFLGQGTGVNKGKTALG
jgi:dienelactone hydrolase